MFRIEAIEGKGNGLVAVRDLEPGEVILLEEAAVVGPASKDSCLECLKACKSYCNFKGNIYTTFRINQFCRSRKTLVPVVITVSVKVVLNLTMSTPVGTIRKNAKCFRECPVTRAKICLVCSTLFFHSGWHALRRQVLKHTSICSPWRDICLSESRKYECQLLDISKVVKICGHKTR